MVKNAVLIVIVSLLMGMGGGTPTVYSEGSIVLGDGNTEFASFSRENIFPGDKFIEEYIVTAKDECVTGIQFKVHIAAESGKVSEFLNFKLLADGVLIYDGTIKNMKDYVRVAVPKDRDIRYSFLIELDTSATSEDCAQKYLVMDFEWAAMSGDYIFPTYPDVDYPEYPEPDEPDVPVEPDEPDTPEVPDEPDVPVEPDEPDQPDTPSEPEDTDQPSGSTTVVKTGIDPLLIVAIVISSASLLWLIILLAIIVKHQLKKK